MMSPIENLSAALEAMVAGVAPSLVSVVSHRMEASGFVWRAGRIVTSDEGLAEDGEVNVTLAGGERVAAEVIGRDPSTAVALLKVERADLRPIAMAAAVPATGALVVAAGAAAGVPTAALALVALAKGPWQSLRGGEIDARIELDARLRRASEGGLALNAAGQAFGMTVFGPRRRVLVIPAITLNRVAARLDAHGRIPRGYLGLGLQPVTVEGGGAGAMVMSVDPNGPGAAADIRQGDILIGWDGKPLDKMQPLLRSLGPDSIGKGLALELRRSGEVRQARLTIGERPLS